MPRPTLLGAALRLVMVTSCAPASDHSATTGDTAARDTSFRDITTVTANVFDPATARVGDTIAGLVLENLERQRAVSGEWVGSAHFRGTLLLTGQTFAHPDGPDYPFPCFEVDSPSAPRLPRWEGDTRRPWFCFENSAEARSILDGSTPGRRFSIRVDRFTIHRNLTGAVNSARLFGLSLGDTSPGRDSVECFRTNESVLARQPGSVADGPPGLAGLIALYGGASAASGVARLIDSDGRSLGATWHRVPPDTIAMTGFDDFLQVEMRLAVSDSLATGLARAHSDAALERNSSGKRVEFRREWRVTGRRASCGSLP